MEEKGGVTANSGLASGAPSLRDRILAVPDGSSEIIEVPEWDNVKVEVRSMTGAERAAYIENFGDEESGRVDWKLVTPTLLIASCYDPDSGERVFQPGDVEALNAKNAAVTERIAKIALRLAGLDTDAEKRLGKGSSRPSAASTTT